MELHERTGELATYVGFVSVAPLALLERVERGDHPVFGLEQRRPERRCWKTLRRDMLETAMRCGQLGERLRWVKELQNDPLPRDELEPEDHTHALLREERSAHVRAELTRRNGIDESLDFEIGPRPGDTREIASVLSGKFGADQVGEPKGDGH